MDKNDKRFKDIVLIEEIPEEGLSIAYESMPGLLSDVEEYDLERPAKGTISLKHVDGGIEITGHVEADVSLGCHRCLDRYTYPVEHDFSSVLVARKSDEERKEEIAIEEEDLDTSFFDGKTINIGEIFREEILLQLPMRQLCSENCKGLCPRCGANLNRENCSCPPERDEGPFAVLKSLKTGE